jgi:threonine/homoserine/homoserine lactone efflux protein
MLSPCFFAVNTRSRRAVSDRNGGAGRICQGFLTLLGTNLASLVLITFAVLAIAGAVTLNRGYLALLGIGGSLFIGWEAVRSLREIWAQGRCGE